MIPPTVAAVPGHVRAENVMDFDIFSIPGADEDVHRAWKRLHEPGVPDFIWASANSSASSLVECLSIYSCVWRGCRPRIENS